MRDRGCPARLIAIASLACASVARADPPSPTAPASSEPPQPITVRAPARPPGAATMTASEVREVPGAFGDAFRAIDALPGVTPIVSGLPFFFVRGAPPGNVGTFVDGVRVPLLFHLGAGPSVVHPGLLDRVDFFPGGYPARYGRFAGAILAGDLAPPKDRAHGEANLRVFDAGALVEAPFGREDQGHALVAGRYGYPGLVLPIFAPDTRLAYWDYQTREAWALTDRDVVSVFAFGSYDDLQSRDARALPFHEVLGMQFHRVDLRYDRALPNGGRARVAVTLGADASNDDRSRVSDTMAQVRTEIDAPLSRAVRVRGGADVALDEYDLDNSALDDARLLYPPRDDLALGAWIDLVWRPAARVEIVPGLRGDLFGSHRLDHPPVHLPVGALDPAETGLDHGVTASALPAVDPRLAVRVGVARRVTYVATFGVAHQRPSFFVPVPGLQISELKPGLQSSVQTSQGIEVGLPADVTASVTGFVHEYFGLTDITETCSTGGRPGDVRQFCADDRVRGRAYGVEVYVRRSLTKRITGWLSYTWSRAQRQARLLDDPSQIAWVPSEFDRPHVLSAVAAYDLGKGWRAGARFLFDSGRPYSRTIEGIAVPPYDTERLPDFWRLDLRLEKQWRVGEAARVAAVLEGENVTLNKEAVSTECRVTTAYGFDACTPSYVGPITIPSVGVEVYW